MALEQGKTIEETLTKAKRLTSGLMVANGVHLLNAPELVAANQNRLAAKEATAKTKWHKDRRLQRERINAAAELRERKPDISTWSLKDCGVYLQYKKLDSDKAMPAKVLERQQRCQSIAGCPSPSCLPHASDDDDEDTPP